jgi:nucleoid DNA-binding protein
MVKKSKKAVRLSIPDLAEKMDFSPSKTREVFKTLTDTLEDMAIGSKIAVAGLGVFEKVQKKARMGRNPHTGEKIKIPSKVTIRFKLSSGLKDL